MRQGWGGEDLECKKHAGKTGVAWQRCHVCITTLPAHGRSCSQALALLVMPTKRQRIIPGK